MKDVKYELTALVVTFNHEATIEACVESLYHEVDRIVVIDNASKDGTVQRVLALAIPHLKVILQDDNLGFAKAVNRGLSSIGGPSASETVVALVNPDVFVASGTLAHLASFVTREETIGIAAPLLVYPDGTTQASARRFPNLLAIAARRTPLGRTGWGGRLRERYEVGVAPDQPIFVDWVIGAVMVFNLRTVGRVGAFDERFFLYGEDVDWCRRIWTAGLSVVLDPRVRCVHVYMRASRNGLDFRNRATRLHWASLIKLTIKYPRASLRAERLSRHGSRVAL